MAGNGARDLVLEGQMREKADLQLGVDVIREGREASERESELLVPGMRGGPIFVFGIVMGAYTYAYACACALK